MELRKWLRLRYQAAASFYKAKKGIIDVGLIISALVIVGISGVALRDMKKSVGETMPTSKWEALSSSEGMSPADAAMLKAERTITNSGKTERPNLWILCMKYQIEVMVSLTLPLEAKHEPFQEVRIRLDDGPSIEETWVRSETALYARNPALLMRRISEAKRMLIEVTALDTNVKGGTLTDIIEFDVRGLDQHLPRIEAACERR